MESYNVIATETDEKIMKIETDKTHIKFIGENTYEIFMLGQLCRSFKEKNIDFLANVSPQDPIAKVSVKLTDFPMFIYNTVTQ